MSYNTRQRELILDYIKKNAKKHLTADDIADALKAEQDLARIKVEAVQKVEQARAAAEAYRLKNEQITDKTLAMEWISKWDGKLPTVASGDGGYMIDISKILEEAAGTVTGQ